MKSLLVSILGILLCSCIAPKLSTDGDITCSVYGREERGENIGSIVHKFVYPLDEKSRQVLSDWIDHYNKRCCFIMPLFPAVPRFILKFPDKTDIWFYDDGIYICPFAVIQYSRQIDAKDKEFVDYIRRIIAMIEDPKTPSEALPQIIIAEFK